MMCAEASYSYGYEIFALQRGGDGLTRCLSSENAVNSYKKYGTSGACNPDTGLGGNFANQVYKIVNGKIGV